MIRAISVLDIIIPSLFVLVVLAAGLAGWRLLRGPAPSRRQRIGHATLLAVVILPLALSGTWCLAKSPTVQLLRAPIYRVETQSPVVALTFDDGPTARYTGEVLAILREHQARATFFVTGKALERSPDLGRQIVAEGHELGNHSYSHTPLIGRSLSFIDGEIGRTDQLIRQAGHQGEIFFRPPNGTKLVAAPVYLVMKGRTAVTWDVAPESDPAIAASAERIAADVLAHIRPGSIVLLHVMYESRAETRAALGPILDGLQARGYRLVTLSELLAQADR